MKHIFQNLRSFVWNEKLIFLIMIICILSSSFILNFSYGLYKNFQAAKTAETESLNELPLSINKDHAPTHQQVRRFVESLSDKTLNEMHFFISGKIDDLENYGYPYLDSRIIYRNGKYAVPTEYRQNAEKALNFGRMISDEEEQNGEYVACIETALNSKEISDGVHSLLKDDDTLVFMNQEYKVVGGSGIIGNMVIPFLAVPDDFIYNDVIIITCENHLNRNMYRELITKSDEYMPGAIVFPELKLPDDDTISIFDNIIAISVLISVFSAFNFVLLYNFIIEKRNHDLAVMQICGCSKYRVFFTYVGECLMMSIPLYIIGTFLYHCLLNMVLKNIYDYILDVYSLKVYAYIFSVYITILFIAVSILVVLRSNKTIVSALKEIRI